MSVWKRTWGDGKTAWVCDYKDQAGKWRRKTFDLKADAKAFEVRAKSEIRAGIHTADSASVTVADAAKDWLKSGREAGLEPTTLAQREQHVRLHIVPFLDAKKLSQLTVPIVRAFESDLRDAGRSPTMVRKVLVSLSGILADAQGRGKVARNVVREAPPRRKPADRHKRRLEVGVDIPTPAEAGAILGKLAGPYRALVIVALLCGLRASEIRGIDWRDVDLDGGTLAVRQRANCHGAMGSPKSAAGRRTVPLSPIAVNALRERKLATGGVGLVFASAAGKAMHHHVVIRDYWWPAQIAAGVTSPTIGDDGQPIVRAKYSGIHAARHFYASWCINPRDAGGLALDAKTVQTRLGHANIAITLDTYGHLFPRRDEADEMAAGEAALLGAT